MPNISWISLEEAKRRWPIASGFDAEKSMYGQIIEIMHDTGWDFETAAHYWGAMRSMGIADPAGYLAARVGAD